MTDWEAGKSRQRKSVGVRMPDDIICQVTPRWWWPASASMVALQQAAQAMAAAVPSLLVAGCDPDRWLCSWRRMWWLW